MNKPLLYLSLLSIIIGVAIFLLMSHDDPAYLRILMPLFSASTLLLGCIGFYKSIKANQ
ncbi:hypothetical protein [Marinicrinis sediminis]|uniref:hypothetical protein n=1 Tax=Marinicrinis sediminis TaxID=1652465 RepID=UPI0036D321C2